MSGCQIAFHVIESYYYINCCDTYEFLNFITFIAHCVKGTSMRSNPCYAAAVTEILCKTKLYFKSIYSNTTFIYYIHMLNLLPY